MSLEETGPGVQFAAVNGKRSSQGSGRSIFADAVRAADESVARSIEATGDWRKGYIPGVREVVAVGARSPKDALRIASDGLDAARRSLCFVTDRGDASLADVLDRPADETFRSVEVAGRGPHAETLEVPYRGETLSGDSLKDRLDRWERSGVLEPSCKHALTDVIAHPEWLDLSDSWFVLLGAASEMGPLELLSRWGANVVAVDLPRRHLWDHIVRTTELGAGRTFVPMPVEQTTDDITAEAGADLLTELPRIASWIKSFDAPLIVGNYVYADGSTFVRVAGAADALLENLTQSRPETTLAYLATPTDVFAVPFEIVSDVGRDRARERTRRALGRATFGKLYAPTYVRTIEGEDGKKWGIADGLVPIQGANYALAKSIQRWRAVMAREEGTTSSAIVAPATRTRSVTKNRLLAAAYRGAGAFGVEIFEPATCRALTAALLVRDLRDGSTPAHPATPLDHPYELFCDAALHGGMWRMHYEPRSVLPLGVAIGAFKRSR